MATKRRSRMEDILRGRNRALQELGRGAPLLDVLATLASSAEEVFPEMRCSILLLDEDKRCLRHGVAPSLPKFYVDAVEGVETGPLVGSCGAASFLGTRVVVEDIQTHRNWEAYRDLAARAGVRACWSEPIVTAGGEMLGTFAMYYGEVRAPEPEELEFIETTAHLAGIAIERNRIDDQRRESERRFRALFNQRGELAGFITPDGTVTDANARALKMIGAQSSEIVGRKFWETPWWTHDPALQERLRQAIARAAGGEFIRFEADHPNIDDVMAKIDFSLTPILDESGKVQFLFAEGLDVTEQKQTEEDLRESQKRAYEAEKLASMATMTAGIAHDIGAPMTVILGYAEMMRESLPDEKNRRRAQIIVEQTNRITELVKALLDMVRPDERVHVPVDIVNVIDSAFAFYKERLSKLSIEVKREIESVPRVEGDPNRLQQALLNLFGNAADAMPDGGTLRVRLESRQGQTVRITISDSGHGIEADHLEKIFEPFYTTKQRGHGTGLGLLVAKGIVDEHHGSLTLESSSEQGTTFVVELPAVQGATSS